MVQKGDELNRPIPCESSYLEYLSYFRQAKYSRFLQYPQALHHLSLLTAKGETGESFRRAFREQPLVAQELAGKQIAHWAAWRETTAQEAETATATENRTEANATGGAEASDSRDV